MEQVKDSNTKQVFIPDGSRDDITYEQYKAHIIHTAKTLEPNFIMDEHFKTLIKAFSLYFWQDEAFEKEGYGSLQKGIFLTGNVGRGKTFLMNLFRINTRRQLKIISTNRVADTYQENGAEGLISTYADHHHYLIHFCFDDLGAERTSVKHMGNELNPMERLILERYDHKKHYLTHFTSNLDAAQIEALYGTRVRSRLREMVNFFELGGDDRRK
jgi:DNA replication protein DnaC